MDRSVEHRTVKSFAEQRAAGGAPTEATNGMACPRCHKGVTMVCDTVRLLGQVRRYRQCANPNCRHKFVTKEKIDKPNV